jgi:RNA recognition motif-containing protein
MEDGFIGWVERKTPSDGTRKSSGGVKTIMKARSSYPLVVHTHDTCTPLSSQNRKDTNCDDVTNGFNMYGRPRSNDTRAVGSFPIR